MTNTREITRDLDWRLVVGLGSLALVRPVVSIVGHQTGFTDPWWVPVLITVAVTVVWVLAVGTGSSRRPVLTLVGAGLVYAVLSTVLSGILSPILTGELQGPLAMPLAIVPLLLFNAGWGALAGVMALGVQRLRGRRASAPR